jgi:hypothetical protein
MSDDVVEPGENQPSPGGLVCGNCGAAVQAGQRFCPDCGAALPPPPDLVGTPTTGRYEPKDRLLLVAGILVSIASPFIAGIGLLAALITYLILRIFRRMDTPFIRGMGIGLIVVGVCLAVCLLGGLAICLWFFVAESQHH